MSDVQSQISEPCPHCQKPATILATYPDDKMSGGFSIFKCLRGHLFPGSVSNRRGRKPGGNQEAEPQGD
jgi:hypothetical protein